MEKKDRKSLCAGVLEKIKGVFDAGKGNKIKNLIVAVLVVAILLIFATSFFQDNKEQEKTKTDIYNFSAMEYCEVVENRLISVLENVKGVGKVEAFIMVDSSPTIRYLEETSTTKNDANGDTSQSIQTTIVMTKNGSITSPVVVVEIMPKITGVLIVASGAKDIKLKTTLTNVASTILSVDVSKVEVLEGKA